MNDIDYISIKDASIKWNMDESKIGKLIRSGKISGVIKLGCHWLIPKDTTKPIDGRTKLSKEIKNENIDFFRYPNFLYQDINSIFPPLDNEELILKNVMEEFLRCNYENADNILSTFPINTNNRYHRIYYLYLGSMVDIYLSNINRFLKRFNKLNLEYKDDFPYKKEMIYLLYELDATLGYNNYFIYNFKIDSLYNYHPSFIPHLIELLSVSLFFKKNKTLSEINSIEISARMLEETKYPFELQSIYIYIGSCYAILGLKDKMNYYYNKALNIAYKYNSFYGLLDEYYYMNKMFDDALSNYPIEFKNKLDSLSKDMNTKLTSFVEELLNNSIYNLFPQKDYILIFYALNGYTNKEVANLLNLKEVSIAKKYSEIYDIANVKGKNELINLYNNSVNKSILNSILNREYNILKKNN